MLVLLTGLKGSGKSTVANYLVEKRGFTRLKFAGPLKEMLKVLGLTDDHIEGHLKEEPCDILGGHTPRWAMQSLGTEWARNCIHKDLWVDVIKSRIAELGDVDIVIDDLRFNNELAGVKSAHPDAITIRIDRDASDGPIELQELHASEKEIMKLPVDSVIKNTSNLASLLAHVQIVLGLPIGAKRKKKIEEISSTAVQFKGKYVVRESID